jgi:hypothetical protein
MAGFYSDVPDHRMTYDADGSIGLRISHTLSSTTTLSGAQMQELNDEDNGAYAIAGVGTGAQDLSLCIIFPELRDITGYKFEISGQTANSPTLYWSNNTTNGLDGTWTSITAYGQVGFDLAALRSPSTFSVVTGVKGLRFRGSYPNSASAANITCVHLYGERSSTSDRLEFWHPTDDEKVDPAFFDFGDVYQGQTLVKQFRVKNLSGTLTANTITLSREANTDNGTQTTVAGLQFSDDNATWGDTESITSLAAGAISSIYYVEYAPTTSANLGLRWARLKAVAASWT